MIDQSLENVQRDTVADANYLHLKYREKLFKVFVRGAKFILFDYFLKNANPFPPMTCLDPKRCHPPHLEFE